MLSEKAFKVIYENYDNWRKIDSSVRYGDILNRLCEKYNFTRGEFFNAIEMISYTKFNMKYYQ